nr:hypothetical protein [Tanacetum cinerariifolium]
SHSSSGKDGTSSGNHTTASGNTDMMNFNFRGNTYSGNLCSRGKTHLNST